MQQSKIAFFKPLATTSAPKTPPANTGGRGFFNWLKATQPRIYGATMVRIGQAGGLAGLGLTDPAAPDAPVTTSPAPVSSSVADSIKNIVFGVSQAYLTAQQLRAQKEVLDLQLQRAKAGLAPLDINMAQYGLTGPQVSVGMSADTKQLVIIGALVLGGVYLLPKLLRR